MESFCRKNESPGFDDDYFANIITFFEELKAEEEEDNTIMWPQTREIKRRG